MRITSKGQVTIPAEIRERAGLLPQTEVDFEFDGEVMRIVRAQAGRGDGRGARLYDPGHIDSGLIAILPVDQ